MTLSEGYYTNQRVLGDVCHTQYITDARLCVNQRRCNLKNINYFLLFVILDL